MDMAVQMGGVFAVECGHGQAPSLLREGQECGRVNI
jgi:hypothetical protein